MSFGAVWRQLESQTAARRLDTCTVLIVLECLLLIDFLLALACMWRMCDVDRTVCCAAACKVGLLTVLNTLTL